MTGALDPCLLFVCLCFVFVVFVVVVVVVVIVVLLLVLVVVIVVVVVVVVVVVCLLACLLACLPACFVFFGSTQNKQKLQNKSQLSDSQNKIPTHALKTLGVMMLPTTNNH